MALQHFSWRHVGMGHLSNFALRTRNLRSVRLSLSVCDVRHYTSQHEPNRDGKPDPREFYFRGNRNFSREWANSMSGAEKERVFLEGLGPLSARDIEVQKRLSIPGSNPTTILQQTIAAGTASVHAVRLCLETLFREAMRIPRGKRREEAMAQSHIAPVALEYLLQSELLWGPFVLNAMNGQLQLCYYAILRGLESRITQWIEMEVQQDNAMHMWRGSLLRCLVEAHCILDSDGNKDAAIRSFLHVVSRMRSEQAKYTAERKNLTIPKRPPILCVNTHPALVQLSEAITRSNNQKTDHKLFDQLVQAFASRDTVLTNRTQAELDYDVASALLYYPSYPKDTAALTLLRNFANGNTNAFPERITTPKGEQYFKRFLQRTVDVLEANDNPTESDWVKQKYNVLLDPETGDFATPTSIPRPGSVVGQTKRASWESAESAEPVPFPTFT